MSSRPRPAVRRRTAVAVGAAVLWVALRMSSRLLRRVRGASMAPTLRAGDLVAVLPVRRPPRVGDVVVLRDPRTPDRETVKRVAATAGTPADLAGRVAEVPTGHLAVRGDDPLASTDSRRYGAVPVGAVVARVVARLWPPPPRTL